MAGGTRTTWRQPVRPRTSPFRGYCARRSRRSVGAGLLEDPLRDLLVDDVVATVQPLGTTAVGKPLEDDRALLAPRLVLAALLLRGHFRHQASVGEAALTIHPGKPITLSRVGRSIDPAQPPVT